MTEIPGPTDLHAAALAIEPATRFISARRIRRVIRMVRESSEFHPPAIHDRCLWIDRDKLFQLVEFQELGLDPLESSPKLLLVPEFEEPLSMGAWNELWRILFHAAIDQEFDRARESGRWNESAANDLRKELGPAGWHAIVLVLVEQNLVAYGDPPLTIVREFISFASEILFFDPEDWDAYFPGLAHDAPPVKNLLSDFDPDAIFARTRPEPASAGLPPHEPASNTEPLHPAAPTPEVPPRITAYSERGNDLRAAVELYQSNRPAAIAYVTRLVDRLDAVVGLAPEERADWHAAVHSLLPTAASGGWPVERRLLYEIQRACLAVEVPAFTADLTEWFITFGRRKIKRPLPRTKWVEANRRLHAALRYAQKLLPSVESSRIEHLVEHAAAVAERNTRDDLRPHIASVLDDVGLAPRSVAERVSRAKLVEELLDNACAHGYIRIGDLRDAVARNRVKLPDLMGPGELVRGDPLIRANRLLAVRLDGVYRRGEVYMRALQRFCSLFFGTRLGRGFTRFVALPFGGAYLLLEAIHHMVAAGEDLVDWLSGWSAEVEGLTALAGGLAGTLAENPTLETGDVSWTNLIVAGVILFLLIHWPAFRRAAGQAAKLVFTRLPRAIARSSILKGLINNRVTRAIRRFLVIPLAVGAVAGFATQVITHDWISASLVGGGTALFMGSFFRTPLGRGVEDRLDEAATRIWRIVSVNFITGLLTLILQFFQALFHAIDQAIYTVDERLRFREGQGRTTFAVKVLVGGFWFLFTYLFRFAWTLLVEPQINPIKHFPVVTVSHKLLLPLIPSLAKQFRISEETVGTIVFGIPGIFGFLVWELKENWKLYRANASPTLRPAMVGSHGEKVRALLRPGFHSGVIPKTFAKLRKALRADDVYRAVKHRHHLHHIAEAVHRLATRELIAYLRQSPSWAGATIHATTPVLTPNRILIPLMLDEKQDAMIVCLEERGGWIIASIPYEGGLTRLSVERRESFITALAGLYKFAGVHTVREQAVTVFGPQARTFDAVTDGLVIPMPDGHNEFFAYNDGPELISDDRRVASKSIVLSDVPLPWTDWADWWEWDAAGLRPKKRLLPGWTLLPSQAVDSSNDPSRLQPTSR